MDQRAYLKIIEDSREHLFLRAFIQLGDFKIANQILEEILNISLKVARKIRGEHQLIILLYRLLLYRCNQITAQQKAGPGVRQVILHNNLWILSECPNLTDTIKVLIEKINLLPEILRCVLIYYYFDKREERIIGPLLGMSEKKVRRALLQARSILIRNLVQDGRELQYFGSDTSGQGVAPQKTKEKNYDETMHQWLIKALQELHAELDLNRMEILEMTDKLMGQNAIVLDREEKRLLHKVRWKQIFMFIKKRLLKIMLKIIWVCVIVFAFIFAYVYLSGL